MRQEFFKIIEEFLKLNERGYVESISKEKNSCGLTLEHLLGKEPDSMFFPDYNGVELKTTTRFSRYNINLFSLTFDGPSLFESNYMLETYGKIDKTPIFYEVHIYVIYFYKNFFIFIVNF